MVGGILAIVFGILGLFMIGKSIFSIISMGGASFMLEYLASSSVYVLASVLGIVGGVLLINKNRWGWILVVGDCISNILHFIITVVTYFQFPMSLEHLDLDTLIFLLYLLYTMAVPILFFMPGMLRYLKVKGEHIGLAAGIGLGFVIVGFATRYIFSIF